MSTSRDVGWQGVQTRTFFRLWRHCLHARDVPGAFDMGEMQSYDVAGELEDSSRYCRMRALMESGNR